MSPRKSQLSCIEETLGRLEAKLDKLEEITVQARLDIAALKVKAGIWGGMAGAVAAIAAFLLSQA